MAVQNMGVIGLGVMGRNLARNLADHGYGVVAYDAWETARTDFAASLADEPAELITLTDELAAFAARLPAPRAILIMIKAGAPVDQLIDALTPLLEPGDLLIDGGNSHYHDTVRREAQHRNLMLGTMAGQVITHGRIKTTAPKAKELRGVVDKLINTAKRDDLASRRQAVKVLKDKTIVRRLFEDVAPELDDRNSGYTRILKLGPRLGDGAETVYLELVNHTTE